MFDSLIKAIQDAVKPDFLTGETGETYTTKPVFIPPQEPTVEAIAVCTLDAIANFVTDNSNFMRGDVYVHISAHNRVEVLDKMAEGRHLQRNVWAIADCSSVIGRGFQFGTWHDVESFIINVQAQFEETENRAKLLQVVGNLESGEAIATQDDGVTQTAAFKTGVRRLASVDLPNPITLAPYRTFTEIEQPPSQFVFRLQQGEKGGVRAALFESGGGRWKLEAIAAIKTYLEDRLPDTPIIA